MTEDGDMIWLGDDFHQRDELTVEEVVKAWFDRSDSLLDVCIEIPEILWSAVLEILRRDLTADQMGLLAAGPLEGLLSYHGPAFIDRVDRQAQQCARFNYLLGGVWRHEMSLEIWERVQHARKEVW